MFQDSIDTKEGDDFKNDKKKRILGHNIDKLQKENRPKELKPVFLGAENEKIKAIKGGKKVLKEKEDLLKPRDGIKPWQDITEMKVINGKPVMANKTLNENDAAEYDVLYDPTPAIDGNEKTSNSNKGSNAKLIAKTKEKGSVDPPPEGAAGKLSHYFELQGNGKNRNQFSNREDFVRMTEKIFFF